jgi:hypothetical protein
MAGDLKVVYAAGTMQDAHLLKNVLEEQGIRAIVTNAVLQGGSGVDILGWPTLARVAVNEENAVAAREIAVEFDRSTSSQAKAAAEEAAEPLPGETARRRDMTVAQETLGESWPRCPECGAPRITKCAACGTAGTGFPPADKPEEEPSEASGRLLLCIECDEPFTPEYAHDCEWCGHAFPDGFRPADAAEPDRISPALITMAAITIVVVVGLLAYFAILVARFGS